MRVPLYPKPSRIVERARGAVGARFRLHGRDLAEGLDCVGLAAWALEMDGVPTGYGLRATPDVAAMLAGAGLLRVDAARAGDLLLCAAGPGLLHLAVLVPGGLVHADAGARRVVERPGEAPWPVLSAWRRADAT